MLNLSVFQLTIHGNCVLLHSNMRKTWLIILLSCLFLNIQAQDQPMTAEQVLAEMDSPTFVPTVKVGKVLHEGDSIQYMEMNNVYVYPQLTFKNKK